MPKLVSLSESPVITKPHFLWGTGIRSIPSLLQQGAAFLTPWICDITVFSLHFHMSLLFAESCPFPSVTGTLDSTEDHLDNPRYSG